MQSPRHYSLLDRLCLGIDQMVRALGDGVQTTGAAYPAEAVVEEELSAAQCKRSAGLMRVNHAGEVCAQALYHGQGMVSRSQAVQEKMQRAALEEGDHLAWCKRRLDELGSHVSYLNPLWYMGSFCIGMAAGMIGDKWSLGFLAETERQVIRHLAGHVRILPMQDQRSYVILQQMGEDEAKHRDEAMALGGEELPSVVKAGMKIVSKAMVKIAYWV